MIVRVPKDELSFALDKLCRVASNSPDDPQAYELKFSVRSKGMAIQASNMTSTIGARYIFSNSQVDAEEEAEFCVPAIPLQETVDLLRGEDISFTVNHGEVTISTPNGDSGDDEHILSSMPASEWLGAPKFGKIEASFDMTRAAIIGLPRFEGLSCSDDPGQAPMTAIHVKVNSDGSLLATSTDQARISFLDLDNVVTNFDGATDTDGYEFMMPLDAAKTLTKMFSKQTDTVSTKLNAKRASFSSGALTVEILTETGVENYPGLDCMRDEQDGFRWEMDLSELQRIVQLVAIVAGRTNCKIRFNKSGKMSVSGKGVAKNGSKSHHSIEPLNTQGELLENEDTEIDLICVDLEEALSVPTSKNIEVGLSMTPNPSINPVFVIEQKGDLNWYHTMFKAVATG